MSFATCVVFNSYPTPLYFAVFFKALCCLDADIFFSKKMIRFLLCLCRICQTFSVSHCAGHNDSYFGDLLEKLERSRIRKCQPLLFSIFSVSSKLYGHADRFGEASFHKPLQTGSRCIEN